MLPEDPDEGLAAAADAELSIETGEVGVDGVPRDAEALGDGELLLVVEDALEYLEFAGGERETGSERVPFLICENRPAAGCLRTELPEASLGRGVWRGWRVACGELLHEGGGVGDKPHLASNTVMSISRDLPPLPVCPW